MSALRSALATITAAAMTAGLVALSRVPMTAEPGEHGELRLAWRFASERVERCRVLTGEELARLPVHMRRPQDCERTLMPYRLDVQVDGRPAVRDTARPRGAEGDRPLSIYRRVSVAAGRHAVRVIFAPETEPGRGDGDEDDDGRGHAGRRDPRSFALDTTVVVAPRQVLLFTIDDRSGRLVLRSAPPAP